MQKLIKFKFTKISLVNRAQLIIAFLFFLMIIIISQRTLIYKYSDNLLKNLGFSLIETHISGISKLNENEIKKHIIYKNCENLFCINLEATKSSLERLDWVKNANLRLVLPSKLRINIREEQPKFIFNNGDFRFLLNSQGKKIGTINNDNNLYKSLVVISGENVVGKINDLRGILNTSPDLAEKITSAKLISNRRWSLVFSNLTTLDLPEKNPEEAFKKLDVLNKKHGILNDNLKKIDLRVKDRMIIKFNINNFSFKESKV